MRRLAAATLALAVWWVAPAGAHPGHGLISVNVEGDTLRYSPASVTVGVGEGVVWFWQGTVSRNHSVTADPGQLESFDSDPGGPPTNETHPAGDSFSHVFQHAGTFTYHCQVHAGMTGAVEVVPLPGPAKPLRLTELRVTARGGDAEARFQLSKGADLVGRIERQGERWHTVKTFNRNGRRGDNRLDLPVGSLKPGSYRLALNAYDDANRRTGDRTPFTLE